MRNSGRGRGAIPAGAGRGATALLVVPPADADVRTTYTFPSRPRCLAAAGRLLKAALRGCFLRVRGAPRGAPLRPASAGMAVGAPAQRGSRTRGSSAAGRPLAPPTSYWGAGGSSSDSRGSDGEGSPYLEDNRPPRLQQALQPRGSQGQWGGDSGLPSAQETAVVAGKLLAAAEVMRDEGMRQPGFVESAAHGGAQAHSHVEHAGVFVHGGAGGVLPELPDKGHVQVHIAPFDEFLDFGGDG